jgi:hypothetical protein
MSPYSYRGQLLLLRKHNVPTKTWGKLPGTKTLESLKEELWGRDVVLIEHFSGHGVLRVARRVKCRIYYSAEKLLYLREIEREFPDGFVRSLNPDQPPYWSVSETRKRNETTRAAMVRGIAEELRTPDGFFVDIEDHELRYANYSHEATETYEEHASVHYPGIRSGNFETSFNLTLTARNFRPFYMSEDHGVKLTFGWGVVGD